MLRKKLNIVWLCHFCNFEMKNHFRCYEIQEFAPWINKLLEIFQYEDNIVLHIISPNIYENKDTSLTINNIQYHFYKQRISDNKLINILTNGYFTNFYYIKKKVDKIISEIKPDIIHLHGAENPYYSAAILPQFKKHKILVTIQGFVRKSSGNGYFFNQRVKIEEAILKRALHFGYRALFMPDFIKYFNKKAQFYLHLYPINKPKVEECKTYLERQFQYDCVFYGRICKDKGVEDLIKAISIVKEKKKYIKVMIIGNVDSIYKNKLTTLIKQTNTSENILFSSFLETQEMLFDLLQKGRICVLPTYNDIIPFTITESMILKIPVISYNIEGVCDLNNKNNTLQLVECGSIEKLAEKIVFLLENPSLAEKQTISAFNYVNSIFDDEKIKNQILSAYNQILS